MRGFSGPFWLLVIATFLHYVLELETSFTAVSHRVQDVFVPKNPHFF